MPDKLPPNFVEDEDGFVYDLTDYDENDYVTLEEYCEQNGVDVDKILNDAKAWHERQARRAANANDKN